MSEVMLTVLAQVAEQMGFLTPTGPGGEAQPDDLVVGVVFSGPARGRVVVAASRALSENLARNLLAIDAASPVPAEDALDAVRELANVVAGNLLPALLGDGEYHLGAPTTTAWPVATPGEEAAMDCLEGRLSVLVEEG